MKSFLKITFLMFVNLQLAANAYAGQGHISDDLNIDFAWNGSTFKVDSDPGGSIGKFGGSHFVLNGVVYPGGTLTVEGCEADISCGWIIDNGEPVPQFPDKVIGRITSSGWFLPQPYIDGMIGAIVAGDAQGFIDAYMDNLGKVTAKLSHTIELGTNDFSIADHILILNGMTGTILPEETYLIPVTGGSGKFQRARGQAEVKMIALFNGSGAQTFSIKLRYKKNRDKPR